MFCDRCQMDETGGVAALRGDKPLEFSSQKIVIELETS